MAFKKRRGLDDHERVALVEQTDLWDGNYEVSKVGHGGRGPGGPPYG
jgi:hypothetical protein